MAKLVKLQCTTCGGMLEKIGEEKYRCDSCGLVYERDSEKYEGVSGEEINRASFERWQGRFDEALNCYDRVLEGDPLNFEANWGSMLSEHNIGYITASDGTQTPVFYGVKEERIYDNNYYIKAMQACPEGEESSFALVAETLENARVGALGEEKKTVCDVMVICHRYDNGETEDYAEAKKIYDSLKAEKYKVFCPSVDLANAHPAFTEPKIYAAIKRAKVLIAVASEEKYASADDMKSVWRRYPRINTDGKCVLVSREENVFPGEILRKAAAKFTFGDNKEIVGFVKSVLPGEKQNSPVKNETGKETKATATSSSAAPKAVTETKNTTVSGVASAKPVSSGSSRGGSYGGDGSSSYSSYSSPSSAPVGNVTNYIPLKFSAKDSISTNPDALDRIADAVRRYNHGQLNVINACLSEIRYLTSQWDDRNMEQVLREIGTAEANFERQIPEAELFSRWLEEKANILRKKP